MLQRRADADPADLAVIYNNLGALKQRTGDPAAAEACEAALGPAHPHSALLRENYARLKQTPAS